MNTLVWTDNKTAALFTRCVLGYQNDWFVLSMTPTLEKEVMKQVLKEVISLGFNASLATRYKY
jgi:lipocalin